MMLRFIQHRIHRRASFITFLRNSDACPEVLQSAAKHIYRIQGPMMLGDIRTH